MKLLSSIRSVQSFRFNKKLNSMCFSNAAENLDNDKPLKCWKEIPGPSSLPLIGQIHHFIPGIGAFGGAVPVHELFDNFYKTYGPIVRLDGLFGRPPMLFLFDPEAISQILRAENSMPIRPGFQSMEYYRKHYRKGKDQHLKPTGLITDHGENWKTFRSKVNPVMMQPKTVRLYRAPLDEVARDMVDRIKKLRDENNMIKENLDIELNKWSLESIGLVALGGRIGCLEPSLASDSPARQLIHCVNDIFRISEQLDFQPSLWRYYATRKFKRAMQLYEQQMNLSQYFINRAMGDRQNNNLHSGEENKSILEKLLEIDEEVAVIMASDMLLAGVDTAANSMLAIFYLLAINPQKQEILRNELLLNKEKRPYLKACIKESLRMMPVVAGNARQTTKEYSILGYLIPKHMTLTFAHQYLSMLQSQYPRPNDFLPERWLTDRSDPLHYSSAHPFSTAPFGFGVRMCIGRRIAELEMETFLARVIENFEIDWIGPPPTITSTTLNYVTGPFNFVFKDL